MKITEDVKNKNTAKIHDIEDC